jgi:hypothetical protein
MKYLSILPILAAFTVVACASEDSSNSDGTGQGNTGGHDKGADAALSQTECYVGLKVSDVTYTGSACSGSDTDSNVSAIGPDSWDDTRLNVDIELNSPPVIGKLDLASLTISIPNDDKTMSTWEAPEGACTATATDSAKDEFMGWVYYSIDIACTQPAVPTSDTSLEPLPLNEFTIVTFFSK